MTRQPLFDKITIIGLGLIGSSIARATYERNVAHRITGCDRNEVSLAYGRKHGFIDTASHNPLTAVAGSDLIILATPPSALGEIAEAIAPNLKPGAIIMDTASVKQPAIDAIAPHVPKGVHFLPAHPVAGSEKTGVSGGRSNLFSRKFVILTPDEPSDTPALQQATAFWKALGARVDAMPAALHDIVYAYVSHLPQLLAFAAAPCLQAYRTEDNATLQKFLRLSGSSPASWSDIFLLNRNDMLVALDRYLDVIHHIEKELAQAPDEPPKKADDRLAHTTLFPRIAASCLVTTLMEAEKKAGFSFACYAGTGFADFTAAASQAPEEDIERISWQYKAIRQVLGEYTQRLKAFHAALAAADTKLLKNAIASA